jgi:hypothetical protein
VPGECTDFVSVIGHVAPKGLTFHEIFGGDRYLIHPLVILKKVSFESSLKF